MIGTYIIVIFIIIMLCLLLKLKAKKLLVFLIILCISFLLVLNNNGFKTFLITSSMSTKNHQYIAKLFYSKEEIERVLNKNKVVEQNEVTDLSLIAIGKKIKSYNKYERELLKYSDLKYKLFKIKGHGYRGYLVAIYRPEKVSIAYSFKLGKEGEYITKIAKDNKAEVVINASGYYDPNWNSNGAIPHGLLIKNGKIISEYKESGMGGGLIGLTVDHKLFLGDISKKEITKYNIKEAVSFGPYLIINGKKNKILGDGGLGVAPRTAIGQRKDGIFLFLVVDGRIITSIGADLKEIQKILYNYGAYNATNLDGGSSSELLIKGKIINTPVGGGKTGLRKMPTYFTVKR
ncbi:MAG: phosphodiester glycosidase family protein [Bacilli bacterium]|nr:phosphodiester glycosidase family protein [Bacilli bacterium]